MAIQDESTTAGELHGPDLNHFAFKNMVVRALVGSSVHGTAVGGMDDRDELGICVEPPDYVLGMGTFEQYIYRSAQERAEMAQEQAPKQARSYAGDLDLTVYSLRKYCRLALKGNPSILLLLYVPRDAVMMSTPLYNGLRAMRQAFATRPSLKQFAGYLTAQKQRLVGERGGHAAGNRPELIAQYGFDTKFAGHMVRLGYQGIEYGRTGNITLPMPEPERQYVVDVRMGRVPFNDVLTDVGQMEQELTDLIQGTSPLPEQPDITMINYFLNVTHRTYWNAQDGMHG